MLTQWVWGRFYDIKQFLCHVNKLQPCAFTQIQPQGQTRLEIKILTSRKLTIDKCARCTTHLRGPLSFWGPIILGLVGRA